VFTAATDLRDVASVLAILTAIFLVSRHPAIAARVLTLIVSVIVRHKTPPSQTKVNKSKGAPRAIMKDEGAGMKA
jgi:hypothetical protein